MNKVCLVGRLTKDPELRTTESGINCVSTFIALNNGKDKDGKERKAEFPKVVVYGIQAENLAKYQKQGSLIAIEGKIKTTSWEDKEGNKKYETYIVADRVEFLNSKSSDNAPIPEPDYVPYQDTASDKGSIPNIEDPFENFSKEADLTGLNEGEVNPKDLPFLL